MQFTKVRAIFLRTRISVMLTMFSRKLRRLCSRLRSSMRRRSRPKVVIRRFGKVNPKAQPSQESSSDVSAIRPNLNSQLGIAGYEKPIRVATFNATMFSMALAVPKPEKPVVFDYGEEDCLNLGPVAEVDIQAKSVNDRPKSILKQSPLHHTSSMNFPEKISKQQRFARSKLRVSINLPDNEISLERSRQSSFREDANDGASGNIAPLRSVVSFPSFRINGKDGQCFRSSRTILEVLREVDADIVALQDVKAEEEKGMKPLSDLATALGMKYVFAESWAPEYGNAVLSKWPIKRWKAQKIFDDTDFRNVLKVTVDVPHTGEVNFHCTHLDHLNENWRMKQINAIIEADDGPHILAGGLNSLDEADYSAERWTDIVKYHEEIGKPSPKVEVMRFLKEKQYVDAKDFSGECESVIMIAKGQNVQGTCKYGTRLDYILASSNSPYKFVPGSYSVISSKGTSDHHIVKVDIVKVDTIATENASTRRRRQPKQKIERITRPLSS